MASNKKTKYTLLFSGGTVGVFADSLLFGVDSFDVFFLDGLGDIFYLVAVVDVFFLVDVGDVFFCDFFGVAGFNENDVWFYGNLYLVIR